MRDEPKDATALPVGIPLAAMIQTLRQELQRAQASSIADTIRFQTERVELELQVAVSSRAKGEGGIQFWVVNAGGEIEESGMTTHTFKISLVPVSAQTGNRALVGHMAEEQLSDK